MALACDGLLGLLEWGNMSSGGSSTYDPRRQAARERAALALLNRIREPIFHELKELLKDSDYHKGQAPHACCLKALNQMRISPLEAKAIGRALRTHAELRRKLPAVLRRLREEVRGLEDSEERQNFDCPLLEGTRCLVHDTAKPIGCAAWNPGTSFTKVAWRAFRERDELNDRTYGTDWKLRVIPLWLKRVFARELSQWSDEPPSAAATRHYPVSR